MQYVNTRFTNMFYVVFQQYLTGCGMVGQCWQMKISYQPKYFWSRFNNLRKIAEILHCVVSISTIPSHYFRRVFEYIKTRKKDSQEISCCHHVVVYLLPNIAQIIPYAVELYKSSHLKHSILLNTYYRN